MSPEVFLILFSFTSIFFIFLVFLLWYNRYKTNRKISSTLPRTRNLSVSRFGWTALCWILPSLQEHVIINGCQLRQILQRLTSLEQPKQASIILLIFLTNMLHKFSIHNF